MGVVAHRSRAEQAHRLQEAVGAAYLAMDNGTLGCEANHRRTWKWLAGKPSEWAVVLEDDAVPVDDFADQLDRALAAAPGPIVSLYRGHNVNNPEFEKKGLLASDRADRAGAHWIAGDHLLHAVAVVIRTDLILDMLEHIAPLPDGFPIDESISHWARAKKTRIHYCHPSIVDHDDGETVILRHQRRDKLPRPKGRVAYQIGGRDVWSSETVTL